MDRIQRAFDRILTMFLGTLILASLLLIQIFPIAHMIQTIQAGEYVFAFIWAWVSVLVFLVLLQAANRYFR